MTIVSGFTGSGSTGVGIGVLSSTTSTVLTTSTVWTTVSTTLSAVGVAQALIKRLSATRAPSVIIDALLIVLLLQKKDVKGTSGSKAFLTI
jgi:hypothetical protein